MKSITFIRPLAIILIFLFVIIFGIFDFFIKSPELPNSKYFEQLSAEIDPELKKGYSYKIGIVYPTDSLGEIEVAKRFCIAAQKLNWKCYIFNYNWQTVLQSNFFAKLYKTIWGMFARGIGLDFIIELYPAVKHVSPIGKIKTYLLINQNMSAILSDISASIELGETIEPGDQEKKTRENYRYYFWRNIGDYDGYIDSGYRYHWLEKFDLSQYSSISRNDEVLKPSIEGFQSSYRTNFTPLKYNSGLFYCGDGVDKLHDHEKYQKILLELEKKQYLNVFGPKEKWKFLDTSYKGTIPSNGISLIEKMQEYRVTLVMHNKFNLRDGIPSTRIFEAAAASNIIITDLNKFVLNEFGNCALYIDVKKPTDDVVSQIDAHMHWIKTHPQEAEKKAKCTHDIFQNKFYLELLLHNIAKMHDV